MVRERERERERVAEGMLLLPRDALKEGDNLWACLGARRDFTEAGMVMVMVMVTVVVVVLVVVVVTVNL